MAVNRIKQDPKKTDEQFHGHAWKKILDCISTKPTEIKSESLQEIVF